jgi:aspartate aminotransferase/aminotransferase
MKIGKQRIYDQPVTDITSLGPYADQLQLEAEAKGIKLPPPVRLQIGEPNFRTPEHIRQAAIESIANEVQTYGPAAGWPWLRELLAEKVQQVNGYTISAGNTSIALGGTGAIQVVLHATIEPGDEVLIPDPCWPIYYMQLISSGATAVTYPLDPHNEWLPEIAQLERLVTPKTRMIIINTPSNPTGAVFPAEIVQQMLDFARRHDLYLLSDECYDQLVFEGEHVSPGRLLSHNEFEEGNFIGIYSFSKTYAMTGWRIGYIVTSSKLTKTIVDVLNAGYTNLSTPIQRAAVAALTGPQDSVRTMRENYQQHRDLVVALLKDYGRYVYTPHGAFYTMIDVSGKNGEKRGREFVFDLLRERNVVVTPGVGFGSISDGYVRVSLAAHEEILQRGIHEICQFAERSIL